MPSEADTCRTYVVPGLAAASWKDDQIAEQHTITDGRIFVSGQVARRGKPMRPDYLLYYKPSYPLAVVEAKAAYRSPTGGMQQAKLYTQKLGLLFAYATNGTGIVEFDATTGIERAVDAFPSPADLWRRYREAKGLPEELEDRLLVPNSADWQAYRARFQLERTFKVVRRRAASLAAFRYAASPLDSSLAGLVSGWARPGGEAPLGRVGHLGAWQVSTLSRQRATRLRILVALCLLCRYTAVEVSTEESSRRSASLPLIGPSRWYQHVK